MNTLVKVRVDLSKMAEFGKKIANREFEKKFSSYRTFYKEIDIAQVVSPVEAQALIMKNLDK